MRIGIYTSAGPGASLSALMAKFEQIDSAGFHTAWLGQLFDYDALTALALAARSTHRVELGSWVIPTYPRHPAALAQQALTVQAAASGRLALGIGVSHHAVIADRFGLDFTHPVRHAAEYIDILRPLLHGERVDCEGTEFRAALKLDFEPRVVAPPLLLAALGPKMLELAGRSADGAAIWLGGARYLEEFAIPRLIDAALRANRPEPRIVCGLPVAITSDPEAGRLSAHEFTQQSSRLPSYRRVLERQDLASAADVALIGDEIEILDALDHLAVLGVTDFNAILFPVQGDRDATNRTFEFLARLARLS
ncbi:MAG: TIGR03564 family F420-dependent LLM class oxidoreductase [Myxococcota bacterium]